FILVGGGIWVAVTLAYDVPGGVPEILRVTREAGHLNIIQMVPSLTEMTLFVVMVSYFIQFLHDYGVDQVTVQRLMATPTLRGMAKATVVNSIISVFVVGLLAFIGLGLYAYVNVGHHSFPESLKRDEIFPFYIIHALPPGISGLVITGVFAAAMSSVDSGINSLSTIVVNDFVKPLRTRKLDEGSDVLLARILTVVFGSFAIGVAFFASTIGDMIKTTQGFLGAFSGPILALFLLGILTKRANFKGWLVGMIATVSLIMWLQKNTEVHFVYYFPITTFGTMVVGYLMSCLIGPAPPSSYPNPEPSDV
ncbi:MAG: hypothetical protein KC931_23905, partial [Candidatus Omnitrophica bacterium]|nr:hypothetical protein [Candidatus Omnitrophota bacterium]